MTWLAIRTRSRELTGRETGEFSCELDLLGEFGSKLLYVNRTVVGKA